MSTHEIPEDAVPIREVSEQTGVNSVTLRAWERRYGLIKPLRTDKGHRLYRPEDIERVRCIQQWLARGVAVGQVKALLEESASNPVAARQDGDHWIDHRRAIEQDMAELNAGALEKRLAQLTALYPPTLLFDECLEPLLSERRTEWRLHPRFGSGTRLAFLETVVARYFASALYRQSRERGAKRVLLVDVSKTPDPVLPVILAYGLGVNKVSVDYFGAIPLQECVFAAEQLQSEAVVLFSDDAPPENITEKHQSLARQLQRPVWLAGRQVVLCEADLTDHCLGQRSGEVITALQQRLAQVDSTAH